MNGKGSRRRPSQISRQTFASNWERTFGKPSSEQWLDENDELLRAACRVKSAPEGSVSPELRAKAEAIYTDKVVELAEIVEQEVEEEEDG